MKKLTSFILFVSYLLLNCSGAAIKGKVRKNWPETMALCTGSSTGNYYRIGQLLKIEALKNGANVEIIETEGSMENVEKVNSGECHGAIIQADALIYYKSILGDQYLNIITAGTLYREVAHLVCHKNSGIENVSDIENNFFNMLFGPPKPIILIGGKKSGSLVTMQTWALEDADYGDIQFSYKSGDEAIEDLIGGKKAQCVFFVSGMNSPFLQEMNDYGDKLKLVEVDDYDFNDFEYQELKVYQFVDIPENIYPNLHKGDSETVAVQAILVVNEDWANHVKLSTTNGFFNAVLKLKKEIKKSVNDNLIE